MPFRPDDSVELPNGCLVCGKYGLFVCGIYTVDYSFMEEILEDDEDLEGFCPWNASG